MPTTHAAVARLRTFGGLVVLFLIGQVLVSALFGLPLRPVLGTDSSSYLAVAQDWGQLESFHIGLFWYLVLLKVDVLFSAGGWFVVAVQAAVAVAAAWVLQRTTVRWGGSLAGWIAAAVYLLHPPIAQWTRYLLTEAPFYAVMVMFAGAMVSWHSRSGGWRDTGVVFVAAGAVLLARPNGILVVGIAATLVAVWSQRHGATRIALTLAGWAVVATVVLTLDIYSSGGGGDANSFLRRAEAGEVLWNDSVWALRMPEVVGDDYSNRAFIGYTVQHPVAVVRLGVTRVGAEMAQVRPFYSDSLNFYLAVSMLAFYVAASLGWWKMRRSAWSSVAWTVSIPTAVLIAVTWAVHEARFGWWFLVLWIPWAGVGASWCLSVIRARLMEAASVSGESSG